ncbi:3-deoxy-D-manno-octulosonic acid transferase [Roseisalinus antarcticus]|uniref:3-deoxy-D-manno-octulosonic acid transferase n=1 Tax=Roseisalinus antarcticus TaxID=254357 RepID=A0A1Y5SKL7_9RHOB|nr:glycosyltransferase N-terminal domain-containing protein [Roseisalinus antarcticus]SLN42598.1 3-deoxy-D-manno-octulosonic acid transferase [Roseisalinus antarcticus]
MRGPESSTPDARPRPTGPIVWVHAAPQSNMDAVAALATRLANDDVTATWIVTGEPSSRHAPLIGVATPGDSSAAIHSFLDYWRPSLAIWMQGGLLGPILSEVDSRGIPRLLIDTDARDLTLVRAGWLGRIRRGLVRNFRHALAVDEEAATRLRRLGLEDSRIEVTGPLEEGAAPLPGDETLRREMATALAGRPLWFAPGVPMSELAALADAHMAACRRSHRLLLVIMPRACTEGAEMAEILRELGLRTELRSADGAPIEDSQVIVADRAEELGVWYRLAPVTFFGGTLDAGGGRSPYEAAALGSAVLHGPRLDPWATAYHRLTDARAAHGVRDATALGKQVTWALAPDVAARLAHAAWSASSATAPVTNRLMELIVDTLDEAGV